MKSQTVYIADDGTRFDNEKLCKAYEYECGKIDYVMLPMGKRFKDPKNCDYDNGSGYVQHAPSAVACVRTGLLTLAQDICPHKFIDDALINPNVHESYPGRVISDSGHAALYSAWSRISCTDKLGREWGQPYYANHPENGKQVCLADRGGGVPA